MRPRQNSPGLRGPAQSEQGQSIPVEVSVEGVDHVIVTTGQPGAKPIKIPVGPGGKVNIPHRPEWTSGTILHIHTNTVPVKGIVVEIIPSSD